MLVLCEVTGGPTFGEGPRLASKRVELAGDKGWRDLLNARAGLL